MPQDVEQDEGPRPGSEASMFCWQILQFSLKIWLVEVIVTRAEN